MLDPRVLRNDPEAVAHQLARRGFVFDADAYRDLDTRRKTLQTRAEELQAERNQRSKSIGKAKAAGSGANQLFVKGAPERVLERCTHARLADGSRVVGQDRDSAPYLVERQQAVRGQQGVRRGGVRRRVREAGRRVQQHGG